MITAPLIKVDADIALHPPLSAYAKVIFRIIEQNRAYLRIWLPWVDRTRRVEDVVRYLRDARRFNQGGQQFNTIIFYQQKIVGLIGFSSLKHIHRKGEIGYWLDAKQQGKGIITRACRALITYGFQEMELNRIVISVSTANERSKKIPKRLGFQYEGILREDYLLREQFLDMEMYSMLKKDWKLPPIKKNSYIAYVKRHQGR